MKKFWCLSAVLALSLALTGCGIEVTEEENRVIAEYAADLLLKYDADYQSRLQEEDMEVSATPAVSEEDMPSEEADTTQADETDEDPVTATEASEEASPEEANVDIAAIVGIEGVSIRYEQYVVTEQYPSYDQNGSFIYLNADKGYKLLVLEFEVVNTSAQDVDVDLLNTDLDYQLTLNGSKSAKPMLTILMDDLGTFQDIVPAEGKQSAVLVFQISEGLAGSIDSLEVCVTYMETEHTMHIQ